MNTDRKIAFALLGLRLSVFLVMLLWTLDKFLRPDHASRVYEYFYHSPGFGKGVSVSLGVAELLIIMCFLLGIQKKWSYGAVLVLHGVSTFSSYTKYLQAYEGTNLLFFAAWPMLAACWALFLLRDLDQMCTIGKSSLSAGPA